jgi:hypothetical protein
MCIATIVALGMAGAPQVMPTLLWSDCRSATLVSAEALLCRSARIARPGLAGHARGLGSSGWAVPSSRRRARDSRARGHPAVADPGSRLAAIAMIRLVAAAARHDRDPRRVAMPARAERLGDQFDGAARQCPTVVQPPGREQPGTGAVFLASAGSARPTDRTVARVPLGTQWVRLR